MRNFLAALFVVCSVFVYPKVVAAEKWELLYEDRTLSFFIDAESIMNDTDGSKLARDKFVFKKSQCDAPFALKESQCYKSVISISRYYNNKSSCALRGIFAFTDGSYREVDFACALQTFDENSFGYIEWRYLFHSANQGTE